MEQYIIKGGTALTGEVTIGGMKNAALGVIAAAAMANEPVILENLPVISDIKILLQALEGLGAKVEQLDKNTVKIDASRVSSLSIEYDFIRKMRASYYMLGAFLGKYKSAQVALPGGCNIGSRPIDQHIKGFEALGATVVIEHGMIKVSAERLIGCHIYLDMVSVGATINVMLAASMAEGVTTIENAAKEPHVVDVANFLNSMGANIKGAGTDVIRIKGVTELKGCTYAIIPDQIEAGTFMVAAAATKGNVLIKNVIPKHLEAITSKLVEIGVKVEEYDDAIRVIADKRLTSTNVKTLVYPGFPTDMQAQIGALLTLSEATSIITETIYENRFKYCDELVRMGANITVKGTVAVIEGVERLSGAIVSSPDLRGGAALVIAGLVADGFTTVESIEYIERGYEDFEYKMQQLGAKMTKVDVDDEKAIQKFKLKVS